MDDSLKNRQLNGDKIAKFERLKSLLNALGLSQSEFASKIEMSNSGISQMLSGKRDITSNLYFRLNGVFPNVNTDWLLTGEGDMFKPGETVKAPEPMDQEEIELRRQVDALKKEIARMANDLSRERDEKKDLLELLKKLTDKYG